MVESVAGAVIDKALEAVLRKVGEGKRLSTEDLVVLMLGLFREIRKDVVETNKRIDALYELMGRNYEALRNEIAEVRREITETNKRIDALYELVGRNYEALNRRIDETNKRIDELSKAVSELREVVNRRIDETNRRIDTLYELMGKIYETLIKQEVARKQ